jgi:predicted TIM-barrel fold metal-dependent hydrolase
MRVDIHGHMVQKATVGASPAKLSMYVGNCQLDHVLVSNLDAAAAGPNVANVDEVDANVACLEACQANPRLVPLYWARVGQLDSNPHVVRGALETEPFRGLALVPAWGGFDIADPRVDAYVEAATGTKCPIVICVCERPEASPARAAELAVRHPAAPMVLCCCGGAEVRRAAVEVVLRAVRGQTADLYVDTSYADAPEICSLVRALGPARVLFGSDAIARGNVHTPFHMTLLQELRRTLPNQDFEAITGKNAGRLFGMSEP